MSGGWVFGGLVLVFGRVREARVAGPGGARDSGCAWVSSERGGAWVGIVRWGVLCRCMCPLAAARLLGQL